MGVDNLDLMLKLVEKTMYAIVKCGGKQIKVAQGDVVRVERVAAEAGDTVTLDQILMVGEGSNVTVGTPVVSGASVTATVLEQIRDEKVIVFKKRRRQNSRRKKGHRQYLTVLKIDAVNAKGGAKAETKEPAAKPAAKKAAAK